MLRVIIITQGVSQIVHPLLNSHHQVVGILESAPRHYQQSRRIRYSYSLVRRILSVIKPRFQSLVQLCRQKKIPYRFMTSSHDKGLEDWIRTKNPDVIVVFSMSQLLKENIFNIPKLGTVNLHPSYLPEYRGPAPDTWQYIDLETNPGVTVHYIDAGEDTGDIIFQERTSIPLGTKLSDKLDKLIAGIGVNLVLKALDAIQKGSAPRIIQSKESPTLRARYLKPGEYSDLINWERWSIEHIWHLLSGTERWLSELYPPKGFYKGHSWRVEGYERCDILGYKVGKFYKAAGQYFIICREGKIYLSLVFDLKNFLIALIR